MYAWVWVPWKKKTSEEQVNYNICRTKVKLTTCINLPTREWIQSTQISRYAEKIDCSSGQKSS